MSRRFPTTFLLLSLAGAPVSAAPAELDGFPAPGAGKNPATGLLLADLDNDGKLEIVTLSDRGVSVIEANGGSRPGFPVALAGADLRRPGAPVACDLDGNGAPEIVVATYDKRLWAITATGEILPGYPLTLDGAAKGPATCLNGSLLLLTTDTGSLLQIEGKRQQRLAKVGWGVFSGVAVADIDGDGAPEYLVSGGDRMLHAVDADGKQKRGFPYALAGSAGGIPAVGDIDDDGRPDIIVGSAERKIHAVDSDGKALAGFPKDTNLGITAGAALADLDGDRVLDLIIGSADGRLYAIKKDGVDIDGFPVKTDGPIVTDAVIGDLDRDGTPEIAVVTQNGFLYLLDHTGENHAGFPISLGKGGDVAPALGDLDNDGSPELVAQGADGAVHAFAFDARGDAKEALLAWPMVGHSPSHGARFGPNPARFKRLSYATLAPATDVDLEVRYEFFDLDRETETETQIRWYLDGEHQSGLDNERLVPAKTTKKHQRWHFTLQEGANFAAYGAENPLSRIYQANPIEILNTPPTTPQIGFGPQDPTSAATLVVKVETKSTDVDDDEITYRYKWRQDGQSQKRLGFDTTKLDPKLTKKNERWSVEVCAFDGEEEGDFARLGLTIQNRAPGAPLIALEPATPRVADVLTVTIKRPAVDPDGDEVSYAYRYWVDGEILNIQESQSSISAGALYTNARVKVQVTARDDQIAGGSAEAEVVVSNTAPPAPTLAIWPARPLTGDALHFALTAQGPDADGDRLRYRHNWTVDGAAVALPAVVPSEMTKKGQRWVLSVIAGDGKTELGAITTEAVVQNTQPGPPLLTLDRLAFATDEVIEPRVSVPAADADGDPVSLAYHWRRDGKNAKLPTTKTSLVPSDTRKGEHWELEVVPSDGTVSGASTTVWFDIANSPPGAPQVQLSAQEITVRDSTTVSVSVPAHDKDDDELRYNYRWLNNGEPIAAWPSTKTKLAPGEGKSGDQWRVEVRAFDGEVEGPPAAATFRVLNHAPSAPAIRLAPNQARSIDDLACQVEKAGTDPDDNPLTYNTYWHLNGVPFPFTRDAEVLPASFTKKGQVWQCEKEAFDGQLSSGSVLSQKVTIENTPPKTPVVAIVPRTPTTGDDLVCQLATPAVDVDHDPVTYTYRWRVGKKPYKAAAKSETPYRIPSEKTKRGQTWHCQVVPSDAEGSGEKASAKVKIQNSVPSQPVVTIKPKRPKAGETLVCDLIEPSFDIDKDQIEYRFRWFKDGVLQNFAPTSTEVPGRLVAARDLWKCAVTPNDGVTDGEAAESPVVAVQPK